MPKKTKFGIHLPNGGAGDITFSHLRDLTVEAEKLGFDSVWVADHLIYPPSLGPPEIYEALTTLSALSQVSNRLLLGTSVLLPLRNPLLLADMTSTLDRVSGGRLILGIGVGWYKPEFDASSVPFGFRGEIQEEEIQILKMLWNRSSVDFKGKRFELRGVTTGPRPIQKPHPKILLGGSAEKTFKRIAEHAGGWIAWCPTVVSFRSGVEKIKSNTGSDLGRFEYAADFMAAISADASQASRVASANELEEDRCIVGDRAHCVERISAYVREGVTHVILGLLPYRDEAKSMEMVAKEVIPSI